jgi:uncharacterized radical SAM protein YgiQ
MFLPATPQELSALGWDRLDVILVTGDSYIDSPYVGVAVIGRWLLRAGYRVGMIAQPGVDSDADITRLGEPALFWGVTGGCIDSLVANRTASGKRRRLDDYTAGGLNDRRPDRAVLAYANLIRRCFKRTAPIVLGGIEASLRRVAHYDVWSDRIRRSILIDAKADLLVYGMAEKTVLALAERLRAGQDPAGLRGLCRIAAQCDPDALELPAYEEVAADPASFARMFLSFSANQEPHTARTLAQRHGDRWLVHHPPMPPLTEAEMDAVYGMDFARDVHPLDRRRGAVRALETIRFSIPTHRGCYGGCRFCAIAIHEGRTVSSRSEASILAEAGRIAAHPGFRGHLLDVGGPTANMYGFECRRKLAKGACADRSCLFPSVCKNLRPDHSRQIALLKKLRALPGIARATVASGIRHDLVLADRRHGPAYLRELAAHHVSGQLKVAPEHSQEGVLTCMGKPGVTELLKFRDLFRKFSADAGRQQFLTYYFIAAHPGCTVADMEALRRFASTELNIQPEQVQLFTAVPSTLSTLMYWTGRDPCSGRAIHVARTAAEREQQKKILVAKRNLLRYGISGHKPLTKEEGSWARTRTSKKKARRNLLRR